MGEAEAGDMGTTQVGSDGDEVGVGDVLACSAGGDELITDVLSSLVSATEKIWDGRAEAVHRGLSSLTIGFVPSLPAAVSPVEMAVCTQFS